VGIELLVLIHSCALFGYSQKASGDDHSDQEGHDVKATTVIWLKIW